MANLAVLGGEKLLKASPQALDWPPRDLETAERLKELYMSGLWSFNSPAEQEFEREFAALHGAKYGIFMMNGTVTLECALHALGVKANDEFIVPALTWMATATAGFYLGAVPVFVDIDPMTLCLDPEKLEKAITPKTKAIIPVHAYGSTADLERILEISGRHGIPVIEDCAHMHGGFWNGKGVGSWGAVGSFSFQQSKNVSSGEGGICITDDPELAEKIYLVKHIGYPRNVRQGQALSGPGNLVCHNYRGTAFQALILSSQLKGLPERVKCCGENAGLITEAIAGIPGLRVQSPGRLADPQGYYSFNFIFDGEQFKDIPKKALAAACAAEGATLDFGTHGPVYTYPLFNLDKSQYRIAGGSCPVAEELSTKHIIGMPHRYLYSRDNAEKIAAVVRKVATNPAELRTFAATQK